MICRDHPPTAFTGHIFVSDVPKAWTWEPQQLRHVFGSDIIDAMKTLQHLEKLRVRAGVWLTTALVAGLLEASPQLQKVDFRESGMRRNMEWAVRGGKADVEMIICGMARKGTISPRPGAIVTN